MGRIRLAIILLLLPLFSTLPAVQATSYPAPQLPSELNLITVHTTTLNITGAASQNFTLNVENVDNISLITQLNFNTSLPLSNFTIQILHLNYLPSTFKSPSGKILLLFYFNLDSGILSNINQTSFIVKVPILEIKEFNVDPQTISIQTYVSNWTKPTQYLNNTDANYYYYNVSTTLPTGFAVTAAQAQAIPPFTILSLQLTILASSLLIFRRQTRSKPRTQRA